MWLSVFIPVALFRVGRLLRTKSADSEERRSTYECGFSPIPGATFRFSLYFFQLALIFLVFDVELVVLIPAAEIGRCIALAFIRIALFVIGLVLGLVHEWREGSLERPS